MRADNCTPKQVIAWGNWARTAAQRCLKEGSAQFVPQKISVFADNGPATDIFTPQHFVTLQRAQIKKN